MKVAVCRPIYAHAESEHEACLFALLSRNPEWASFRSHAPNIDTARALLGDMALRSEASAMLWIDGDITFEVEDAERLVKESVERNALVGAPYLEKASKRIQGDPLVDSMHCFEGGELIPARRVAFGIAALPCALYRETADRLGIERARVESGDLVLPLFLPEVVDGEYRNDDYAFCARVERAGFPMFLDTRARIGHVGRHVLTIDDIAHPPVRYRTVTVNIERRRA